MIERKIVSDNLRKVLVENYFKETFDRVGYSKAFIHKTPLGEKIVIHAARPGLIVGAKGSNVKKLTKQLKSKFKFENPQIEIEEVKDTRIDPVIVAEGIAGTLERFGAGRFKGTGYRAMENAISAGALGIEILITGKIPSSRARRWRFYKGYLKKCGDVAFQDVLTAYSVARLKSGVVGIQVRIMPPGLVLPDKIIMDEPVTEVTEQEVADSEAKEDIKEAKDNEVKAVDLDEKSDEKPKKAAKKTTKKATKKKTAKKSEAKKEEAPAAEAKAEAKTEAPEEPKGDAQ